MRAVYRGFVFALLLCSVSLAAQGPRDMDMRPFDRGKPLFVDGVRTEWAELEQLSDQPLYWVVEKNATYGFTTAEGVQAYGQEHARAAEQPGGLQRMVGASSTCSNFNKNVGCGGIDWLILCPLSQYAHLPDSWNDVISCVQAGDNGYYTVLYKCYDFSPYPTDNCWYAGGYHHIIWVSPGTTITDLNLLGMNNLTSSIRFCTNTDPYSCTQ